MLTFLELYQTLLGFVLFKLYTDAGLVYPPPLDSQKDEGGAGVGAFSIQTSSNLSSAHPSTTAVEIDSRKISGKNVRQTIKKIMASSEKNDDDFGTTHDVVIVEGIDEEFVPNPSTSGTEVIASLPTFKTLSSLPYSSSSNLFAPYTFFLSRETSRPIFEFILRSFGGRVGWPSTSGSGSPVEESDDSITHIIIDRPIIAQTESALQRERRMRRKYVQPQWIVDCINSGKILLEDPYAQGRPLPPHLSPFGEHEDAYNPSSEPIGGEVEIEEEESDLEIDELNVGKSPQDILQSALANAIEEPASLRAIELAAEAADIDYSTYEKELKKIGKETTQSARVEDVEKDMNKMMMSNKQKKLYEKMKFSQKKRETEVSYVPCVRWQG